MITKKDKILVLNQLNMSVVVYKAKFHALSYYATLLLGTKDERIQLFVNG